MTQKAPLVQLMAIAVTLVAAEFVNAEGSGLAALKAREKKVKAVVKNTIGATIAIEGANFASGSGVIVSSEGLILTAAHVIAAAGEDLTITFPDGRSVRAKSLGANSSRDAGMAQIVESGEWPYVEIGDPDDVNLGEWCVALGHPGGYDPNRTPPVRLGRVWTKRFMGMLGSDCTLVGGDSGGPLFDLDGKLIGIHSSIGGLLRENRHVPMDAYTDDWEAMLAGKTWGSQGVMMGQVDPDIDLDRPAMGVKLNRESEDGVEVSGLSEPSPAGEAGIEVGDIIRKIGKEKIWNFEDMVAALEELKAGEKVIIGVERGLESFEYEVKLGRLGRLWDLDRAQQGPGESEEEEEPVEERPSLGVLLVEDGDGAEVYEVVPGSAAEKAGILAGDVILKVEGEAISSAAGMAENVSGRKPGDNISLLIRRGDGEKELSAQLGKAG